jgi:tetratricopeptide (TPR) repeat protein
VQYANSKTINMKRFLKLSILLILFASMGSIAFGQNAKKHLKTGMTFAKSGKNTDAIEQFTRGIELDPRNTTLYVQRAKAYEATLNFKAAVEDYDRAVVFTPAKSQTDLYYNSGRLYYELEEFEKSKEQLEKAININKKHLLSHQALARTLLALRDHETAMRSINTALTIKKTAESYYYQGLIYEGMKDYQKAEGSFDKAMKAKKKYIEAMVAQARTKVNLNKLAEATSLTNQAIGIDSRNRDALHVRSMIHVKNLDYPSAINDISTVLVVNQEDEEMFYVRGTYYQGFKQHQSAINDFSKVIALNPNYLDAYYSRAKSYEESNNFQAAVKDYETLGKLSDGDPKARRLMEAAQKRLFELNREQNPPDITILEPAPKDKSTIEIPLSRNEISIKGRVKDESPVQTIKVNGVEVPFKMEDGFAVFNAEVKTLNSESIKFTASDIYNNERSVDFAIFRTEINPPVVKLIAPYASDNNEVYLSSNDPRLYIEGRIEDESLIKSIFIEGATASFKVNDLNPTFSATIDILNKNNFTVRVADAYGNETLQTFKLNRESLAFAEDSPMGKTWVVFIENSNYKSFASLQGPTSDVTLMKGALANYKIHNIIHKKDMTKSEMERFFSIELRDLVRSNQVNSIMFWYAGHGKFVNDVGYWIPVDATRDDEFTYFNINALRAAMQGYPKTLTHTLVITDACESGPTFYQAMRATGEEKSCDDWRSTRFKSSQVLSSAGYEQAADQSQFTRTFANSLLNNTTSCIPIDKIVTQVTVAVSQTGMQRPKFGKISGLEDEGGTFFFVSKE